ncbi:hypothetical protein NDU88_004505 [Pleurodeles waltl]|uniref:Uncharacterized protein n=1 Tax=Pleurodeles waltl TaxID=8319 RepID=A0AAV7M8J5_PLEWA|nr:hypothetical protein NDU88_004505 [Pleurodeles waltl]
MLEESHSKTPEREAEARCPAVAAFLQMRRRMNARRLRKSYRNGKEREERRSSWVCGNLPTKEGKCGNT